MTSRLGRVGAGSLVRRLSFGTAMWVGVLGLTVTTVAGWQYWRTSLRTVDAGLVEQARALAGQIVVVSGLLEIDLDTTATFDNIQGSERFYAVYAADGQVLYRTSAFVPERMPPSPPFQTRAGYREALINGPNESVVVVGQSLTFIYTDIRRLATSLSLASLGGAVLTLPMGVWLRRQLARSIEQIDHTARSLAPGRPTRVDLGRVAEEFVGVARALNGAFDRLDEALARERQLTSDASHELRTPATTLLAEARWALNRPRTISEYQRSLEVCARQGARMKDLVQSLLTLARLEAGTMPPVRESVALRAIVEDAAAELQPLAKQSRVALHVAGDATIWADAVQVRILVSNLLSNAIRYNRADGRVTAEIRPGDGHVVMSVIDTGRGLDPALATRVFERFWRADPARSTRDGGSGLGLAISKAIVDAHSGRIAVESRPGEGTTFRVELPLAPSHQLTSRSASG